MPRLHESLQEEFDVWFLVSRKIATLHEIETHWSFDDLHRMVAIIQMQNEITEDEQRRRK